MVLEGYGFTPTKLEEDRVQMRQVNSRLNDQEAEWLEALKLLYNTDKDSTALKKAAFAPFILADKLQDIAGDKR